MSIRRISFSLVLAATSVLCACSSTYACTGSSEGGVVYTSGGEPRNHESEQAATHVRDSIYHSFMDSIGQRIQELNDVAHRVDSLARIFKDKGHVNLHMDGKTFGPLTLPSVKIPGNGLPEAEAEVPEINTPKVEVPEITVPPIDIEESTSELYDDEASSRSATMAGMTKMIESKSAMGSDGGSWSGYRDPVSSKNMYVRGLDPSARAVQTSAHIWLTTHPR